MRRTFAAMVLVTLLAGCGSTPPVQAPPTPTETTVVPALDPQSRKVLSEAKAAGKQTVTALVLTKPGTTADAERALTGTGAKILSANGPTGSLRAEVPTDAVAQVMALPWVAAVQLDQDIKRDEPTP
jgi:predicted small lipoprotein YifL